jgi:hypothetical protein
MNKRSWIQPATFYLPTEIQSLKRESARGSQLLIWIVHVISKSLVDTCFSFTQLFLIFQCIRNGEGIPSKRPCPHDFRRNLDLHGL